MRRRKAEPHPELWLKTSDATYQLQMSAKTLASYRDEKGGPLIEWEHWFAGVFRNSAHQYEVNGIRKRLCQVGRLREASERKLRLITSDD